MIISPYVLFVAQKDDFVTFKIKIITLFLYLFVFQCLTCDVFGYTIDCQLVEVFPADSRDEMFHVE